MPTTFHAYRYDPKHEVVRSPMEVSTLDGAVDQFTIVFLGVSSVGGTLAMAWEHTLATVPFGLAAGGS